jgi:LytS/YehU family sensor histidine kinase
VLCDKNPQAGKQAISDFAHYLRTNLDVFEHNQTLIPFDKELEHVKHYINLEHMRFEDELKVNYDITRTDFSIPPLTIQPLVENAIKHGILKKKGGGLLSIATYSTQKNIVITVSDTGVGFDSTKEIDTTKHIGIANTRTRLSQACGATLSIKSTEGCGTVATITIPQERVLK